MPEHENKSPDPPRPSTTTKISRKGRKIEFYRRKIELEHENSTPEHEKSIPEQENRSPESPGASPTTKNSENGPKTSKNPKNRKFEVGGTRPEAYLNPPTPSGSDGVLEQLLFPPPKSLPQDMVSLDLKGKSLGPEGKKLLPEGGKASP